MSHNNIQYFLFKTRIWHDTNTTPSVHVFSDSTRKELTGKNVLKKKDYTQIDQRVKLIIHAWFFIWRRKNWNSHHEYVLGRSWGVSLDNEKASFPLFHRDLPRSLPLSTSIGAPPVSSSSAPQQPTSWSWSWSSSSFLFRRKTEPVQLLGLKVRRQIDHLEQPRHCLAAPAIDLQASPMHPPPALPLLSETGKKLKKKSIWNLDLREGKILRIDKINRGFYIFLCGKILAGDKSRPLD